MLISTHEIGKLLDERLTEEEIRDLEEAETVCRKFLTWDFQNEEDNDTDVRAKLREVLGKEVGDV
jgi:DNA mismatch repair protein MSH5